QELRESFHRPPQKVWLDTKINQNHLSGRPVESTRTRVFVASAPKPSQRTLREELHVLLIVRDEFRPAIPRSGCSPAEPVSASPATRSYDSWQNPGNDLSLNGRCVFPPCLTSGDKLILCVFAS